MKQLIQKALQYAPSPRAAIALSMTALLASSCGALGAGPAADGLKLGSLLRLCSRSVELESNRTAKLKAINEQSNHNIMHHNYFGETNRFPS